MGMEMSSIEEMLKEGATLTLEPETAPELPVEEAKPIPKVYEEEQYLTDDEKKQVESFVKQIRLDDSNAILQYGSGTQKKMSAFSEGTLEKVRSKDLGEVGELLNGVVVELKGFDEEEEKGIKGFFKKKIPVPFVSVIKSPRYPIKPLAGMENSRRVEPLPDMDILRSSPLRWLNFSITTPENSSGTSITAVSIGSNFLPFSSV